MTSSRPELDSRGMGERAAADASPPRWAVPEGGRRRHRGVAFLASFVAVALGTATASAFLARSDSAPPRPGTPSLRSVGLEDVARRVGLDFDHGAFRFGIRGARESDTVAMMGGGLCWLDADGDGWLDLFVVNSYTERQAAEWDAGGSLPRSALFHNEGGTFTDASRSSGADVAVRGNGCVAADLDVDGDTDLVVTTAGAFVLLWNQGDGAFREGAAEAGLSAFGWYAGAAAGDVNGDGLPDLVVAGYTNLNAPVAGSTSGFPGSFEGVRDLLYLNEGPGPTGTTTFAEAGREAGLETTRFAHGLGASLSDFDADGDLDVTIANDTDPNTLYENVPWPGGASLDPEGLGFRFEERAARSGVADPNAGMGIAVEDADGDGLGDLFVTNARDQEHAAFSSASGDASPPAFVDARAAVTGALADRYTGWGTSWVDLDLDGDLDLVVANGAIPVTDLEDDAEPLQVLEGSTAQGRAGAFVDGTEPSGLSLVRPLNARGLAVADYDNDGDPDVAVATIGGPVVLLRNATTAGNWLEVGLGGPRPGAVVTVELGDGTILRRELRAGSSYLSSEDPRALVGLGRTTDVRTVTVRWPGGSVTRVRSPGANRLLEVRPPR